MKKKYVEKQLEKLDFVEWDRFTEFTNSDGVKFYRVFGWIEREKDEYKDFVNLEFQGNPESVLFLGTSSKKYSQKIEEILYGDNEDHLSCKRVEDNFQVSNAIQLDEEEVDES